MRHNWLFVRSSRRTTSGKCYQQEPPRNEWIVVYVAKYNEGHSGLIEYYHFLWQVQHPCVERNKTVDATLSPQSPENLPVLLPACQRRVERPKWDQINLREKVLRATEPQVWKVLIDYE